MDHRPHVIAHLAVTGQDLERLPPAVPQDPWMELSDNPRTRRSPKSAVEPEQDLELPTLSIDLDEVEGLPGEQVVAACRRDHPFGGGERVPILDVSGSKVAEVVFVVRKVQAALPVVKGHGPHRPLHLVDPEVEPKDLAIRRIGFDGVDDDPFGG